MTTVNYELPIITEDMTADIVRDQNALAVAVDKNFNEITQQIAKTSQQISDVDTLVHEKTSYSYVDEKIASVAQGSPAGVYDTLQQLQKAFPLGDKNIYVVKSDNNWYYYNTQNSSWTAGGEYLSTLDLEKIKIDLNALNEDLTINIIKNGDFEDGLNGWEIRSGTPKITSLEYLTPTNSLNIDSNGESSQVLTSFSINKDDIYYVSALVKCTRYVSGAIGVNWATTNGISIGIKNVTEGWEIVSRTIIPTASTTARLYVGAINSADLDGYVDNVVVINLSDIFGKGNEPTKEIMDELITSFPNFWVGNKLNQMLFLSEAIESQKKSKLNLDNVVINNDFSSGDLTGWTIQSSESKVVLKDNKYVLNTKGTISQHVTGISNNVYYLSAKIKCTRYTSGAAGLKWGGTLFTTSNISDEYVRVSGIYRANTNAGGQLYVGIFNEADLDCDITDIIHVNLSQSFGLGNELSLEQMDALINNIFGDFSKNKSMNIGTLDLIRLLNIKDTEYNIETSIGIQEFVSTMNKKANEIGMINSNFLNPHGLGIVGQVTTARDILRLGIHASGYSEMVKIWNKKTYSFDVKGKNARTITITTSVADNALDNYYHVFGGKTGTLTTEPFSTRNLLSVVNAPDDRLYVGVILGGGSNRFSDAKSMYDLANRSYNGEDVSQEDIRANHGIVALLPINNPLAYANFDVQSLYEKAADVQTYPASVTKVLSVITALDYINDINEKVTILSSDITSGSGQVFKAGDIVTYKDLIYAMMLPSSNTAATTIARLIGTKILTQ